MYSDENGPIMNLQQSLAGSLGGDHDLLLGGQRQSDPGQDGGHLCGPLMQSSTSSRRLSLVLFVQNRKTGKPEKNENGCVIL